MDRKPSPGTLEARHEKPSVQGNVLKLLSFYKGGDMDYQFIYFCRVVITFTPSGEKVQEMKMGKEESWRL